MRARDFVKLAHITPYEVLRNDHHATLKNFDTMDELEMFLKKNYTIFFSHQWLGWTAPDPGIERQFPIMQAAAKQLAEENATLDKAFIWFDFGSIPQRNRATQMLAVNALPAISSSLHSFVVVAPTANHFNTGDVCDVETYNRRGWCRAEVFSHASRRGFNHMYLATGVDDIKKVSDKEFNISDAVKVFGGEYTCCRLNHPDNGKCDKEELLEVSFTQSLSAQLLQKLNNSLYDYSARPINCSQCSASTATCTSADFLLG